MWPRPAPATLRTARLVLRAPEAADIPALVAGIGNYDVARWLGSIAFPYTEDDARAFVATARPGAAWLAHDADGLVGGVSVTHELGFWLARPAWGGGYATEMADAAIDAHFAGRGAPPLTAAHFHGNDRSANVLAKLGFRPDGDGRVPSAALGQEVDSRRMILTRDDWRGRRRYRLAAGGLRLREIRASDIGSLRPLLGQRDIARITAPIPLPLTAEAEHRWIEDGRYRGRPGFRAVVTTPLGRVVGCVTLSRPRGDAPCRVGCLVDPSRCGQAHATAALRAFIADCAARFDLAEVVAEHPEEHPDGGHFLRKLGFVPAGAGIDGSSAWLEPAANVHYRLRLTDARTLP